MDCLCIAVPQHKCHSVTDLRTTRDTGNSSPCRLRQATPVVVLPRYPATGIPERDGGEEQWRSTHLRCRFSDAVQVSPVWPFPIQGRPIPEKGLSQMSISNRSQLAIDLRSHRRAALHYAPASAAGLVQSWPPRGQEKEGVEPNHVI